VQEETRVPSNGPAVVHCSAGIGRTGTFCTIDIVMRRLQQLPPNATPQDIAWAVAIPQVPCRFSVAVSPHIMMHCSQHAQ
jgi:hypothetical protein